MNTELLIACMIFSIGSNMAVQYSRVADASGWPCGTLLANGQNGNLLVMLLSLLSWVNLGVSIFLNSWWTVIPVYLSGIFGHLFLTRFFGPSSQYVCLFLSILGAILIGSNI
jgi:hypothetical protein